MPADFQPADDDGKRRRSALSPRRVLGAVAVIAFMTLAGLVLPRWIGARLASQPPSVIFILVDTLRADFLGAYGFAGPVSPNLDAFAGESVLFERAFAQAPWTKPSIASLFTSLQPDTHKVLSHGGKYGAGEDGGGTEALPAAAATLAESFQAAGYATAAYVANPWMLREHGFAQGFDVYDQRQGRLPPNADALLRPARRWLAGRKPEQPYFLYLHFMDVHGPYLAPEEDYAAVRDSAGLGPSRELSDAELSRLRPYLRRAPWVQGDEVRDLRTWRGRYAAGVHALDRQLGPFLDELARSGALENTIVVVTADHGEELADNGGWDHGFSLYEHQIRVPLLIRLPGREGGGRRVQEIASLIDLMPTLLARGGVAAPATVQGHDLSPLLDAGAAEAVTDASFASGVKWNPEMRSLRAPDWKLIRDARLGTAQLFDLQKDPHEQSDLAPARPGELERLEAQLAEHQSTLAALPSLAAEQAEVSDEMKKRLEALGYAD